MSFLPLVKQPYMCKNISLLRSLKRLVFFELVGLNDFEIVPADELQFKLIVFVKENCLLVSVMNEGFEHN